jgi:hypothetical protein
MEPFHGTDKQCFFVKGPGSFDAAFEDCEHIFRIGRIIPVERSHAFKFFLKRQNHT